jgi:pilus assembly protein Flp/PilA
VELLRRFWRNESGATAMEYAAMLVLIIVVCMAAVDAVGNNASNKYDDVSAQGLDGKDEVNDQGSDGKRAKKDKEKNRA